jgi:hypothetical protein
MASLKQVEDQIFAKEGFRVRLTPLIEKKSLTLPPYDYEYMAPNKWKLTDWRMARMQRYIPFVKALDVYRGDGTKTVSDMRLGNLRDTYFAAFCEDELAALEGAPESPARD